MTEMIDAEETDLRTHVQLCALRHAAVERRLQRIERGIWGTLTLLVTALGVSAADLIPIAAALAGR